jgi:hypothetical protein
LTFFFLFQDSNETTKQTDVDKLKELLLKGYSKNTRPENNGVATRCDIGMTMIHMDLDESKGVLTSHAWLKMNWTDSKLSWDNATYGFSELHVGADEVQYFLLINWKLRATHPSPFPSHALDLAA